MLPFGIVYFSESCMFCRVLHWACSSLVAFIVTVDARAYIGSVILFWKMYNHYVIYTLVLCHLPQENVYKNWRCRNLGGFNQLLHF